jgi:Uma2 family endonuclease
MKTLQMMSVARRATGPRKRTGAKASRRPAKLLGPFNAGMHLTAREFDAATFDEEPSVRYELIDGILVVTPMPLEQERDPNGELEFLLRLYQKQHPQGKNLDKTLSEQDIHCGENRRRADRVLWTGLGRRPDPVEDVPSIIIEFVSEGRRNWLRDYEEKRDEYLDIGVREYWIFDRFQRALTVFAGQAKGFKKKVVKAEQSYVTPLLPGFTVEVGKILAVAEEWDR